MNIRAHAEATVSRAVDALASGPTDPRDRHAAQRIYEAAHLRGRGRTKPSEGPETIITDRALRLLGGRRRRAGPWPVIERATTQVTLRRPDGLLISSDPADVQAGRPGTATTLVPCLRTGAARGWVHYEASAGVPERSVVRLYVGALEADDPARCWSGLIDLAERLDVGFASKLVSMPSWLDRPDACVFYLDRRGARTFVPELRRRSSRQAAAPGFAVPVGANLSLALVSDTEATPASGIRGRADC